MIDSSQEVLGGSTRCPARTARGMRTPTGEYMTCAGNHAAGDPHGAAFGKAGWFSWTDDQAVSVADVRAHETASRYRHAASHCRQLSEVADYDGCLAAQDEMAMCRCQLATAGRLDLIEAA